jgi:hypothetical protein
MLTASKVSVWRNRYDLALDGSPLATWEGRVWKTGGTFDLAGRSYDVRSNTWGTRFEMTDQVGVTVAAADRVGRKRWSVEAGGRTYRFQRTSFWHSEETLMADDQPVGSVRRTSVWRGDAAADLPGLPLPVQVFVLVVVLTMWDSQAATAAAGA